MEETHSAEVQQMNKIATDINVLQVKIQQSIISLSDLRTQLQNLPFETDENGYDVYQNRRTYLSAQIASLEELVDQANRQKQGLSNEAYTMAAIFRQKAWEVEQKAAKASGSAAQSQRITNVRFGSAAVSEQKKLASQRSSHYTDYAAVLNTLARAAEDAATGKLFTGGIQTISDRGEFNHPGRSSAGSSLADNDLADRNENMGSPENVWSAGEENFVGISQESMAGAILEELGIPGSSYQKAPPDFASVAHANVENAMARGAVMIAEADARLAKQWGITGEEMADYRKENGLVWRADADGQNAYLIPESISDEYAGEKKRDPEPTPELALNAYMHAHHYRVNDYPVYSKDPEWQKLNRAAYSESEMPVEEWPFDKKIDWVCKAIPYIDKVSAKQIANSMVYYSGTGYNRIHWDKEGNLPETKDILKVFDSKYIPAYQGPIYRGLSFASKRKIKKLLKNRKNVWKEDGITSFSRNKSVAEELARKDKWGLVLSCDNNKSAIPFWNISASSWEEEVLSPGGHRNNGWRINYDSILIDKDEHIVYAEVEEI